MSINACAVTISNTPGTSGAFTVAAAVAGPYRAPASGDNAKAVILFVREGSAWEICASVYTHSGTSFSRGTLRDSSTGSRVNFTAAAVVNVIGLDAAALGELGAFFGAFATTAALESAKPAASNRGAVALVGSAAPFTPYISNGTAWTVFDSAADPLVTISASGSSVSQAASNLAVMDITLTANTTFAVTGIPAGAWSVTLILRQDGPGSRVVTWPANTRWASGTAPTLSTAGASIDVVTLLTTNQGTSWFGFLGGKGMG